jgi:hypothetical protein
MGIRDQLVRASVTLEMAREQIEKAPDYDPAQLVDRAFEQRLFEHYGRPGYWR